MTTTAYTITGEKLLDIAANIVRQFFHKYKPIRPYLFVSGGKDSVAVAAAVAYAGDSIKNKVIVVYNELMGNTHPRNVEQTYRILESLGYEQPHRVRSPHYTNVRIAVLKGYKSIHIEAFNRHGGDFWHGVRTWGIPVKLAASGTRWCYNEHKQKHWDALPHVNGKRYNIMGIKMADSKWRRIKWSNARDYAREITVRRKDIREIVFTPILRLTDNQVWLIIREAGLDKHLETYRQCGDSLNCVFCPFRRYEKQVNIIRCIGVDDPIVRRAHETLHSMLEQTDQLTRLKAEEWLRAIEEAGRG